MSDNRTLIETYTRHRAAFVLRLPFGVLLKDDMAYLLKATARDCGVTVMEVLEAIDSPPRTGRAAGPIPDDMLVREFPADA